jgi:hypothetical protein
MRIFVFEDASLSARHEWHCRHAVRVLEALSQAPIPEAGLRRMDASQEHPPIERVPAIGRRSAPGEVGDHRFHSIIAVRREPSGLKWSEHGMVLRASTRMLVCPGGSSTYLGYQYPSTPIAKPLGRANRRAVIFCPPSFANRISTEGGKSGQALRAASLIGCLSSFFSISVYAH